MIIVIRRSKGFSLTEVMVVVAIIVILMVAAINYFTFHYKTCAETKLVKLQKMIEFSVIKARAEGKTVIICAATADSFDSTGKLNKDAFNCANADQWGNNSIVAFESLDGAARYDSNNDKIIANLPRSHKESLYVSLSGNAIYLKISSNGFMVTGNGHIICCDSLNQYAAALIINSVGRVIYTDNPIKSNGKFYNCGV